MLNKEVSGLGSMHKDACDFIYIGQFALLDLIVPQSLRMSGTSRSNNRLNLGSPHDLNDTLIRL